MRRSTSRSGQNLERVCPTHVITEELELLLLHFLWRADTPGCLETIITVLLWHFSLLHVWFLSHFTISGDVHCLAQVISLLYHLHGFLLIYSVKLGLWMVAVVRAGDWNQLNLVQAVLQGWLDEIQFAFKVNEYRGDMVGKVCTMHCFC